MRSAVAIATALLLLGCAGPLLNEYTLYLGPLVGSLEERQILQNLGHFVDNPWAVPGHVELANGQIQATNMLGVNLKYPYSQVLGSSTATATITKSVTSGSEFDVNPAQTQDQESYNLLPVTDPDDLRRLRAIYHYAVCPDPNGFLAEWRIADQYVFQPPAPPPKPPGASSPTEVAAKRVTDQVRELLQNFRDGKVNEKQVEESLPGRITDQNRSKIEDVLHNLAAPGSTITVEAATKAIMGSLGTIYQPYAAPTPSKPGTGKNDTTKNTAGTDSIAFEEKRAQLILSPYGLGTKRWLYWRDGDGNISGSCGGNFVEYPADPARLMRLGAFGAHEFFTDDPKKFSDLVLFVLGGIPNTTGVHVLSAGGTAPTSKAGKQQFFSVGGQTGVTIPSKPQ